MFGPLFFGSVSPEHLAVDYSQCCCARRQMWRCCWGSALLRGLPADIRGQGAQLRRSAGLRCWCVTGNAISVLFKAAAQKYVMLSSTKCLIIGLLVDSPWWWRKMIICSLPFCSMKTTGLWSVLPGVPPIPLPKYLHVYCSYPSDSWELYFRCQIFRCLSSTC